MGWSSAVQGTVLSTYSRTEVSSLCTGIRTDDNNLKVSKTQRQSPPGQDGCPPWFYRDQSLSRKEKLAFSLVLPKIHSNNRKKL